MDSHLRIAISEAIRILGEERVTSLLMKEVGEGLNGSSAHPDLYFHHSARVKKGKSKSALHSLNKGGMKMRKLICKKHKKNPQPTKCLTCLICKIENKR